ncbi:autotransporter outer membrane beta-barrel domain-containing protein [Bradyrhizobium sp. AZCC 2230]|uniref:autotransporter outer membrane beta-barrel domain-containing protein n=1 Tax=Bradyrhizobium sp. AZCC 2230 TaxID=3117021 RepID=UPI002FF18B0E
MTNIWACPTGIAATSRPAGARFRNAFLGTVAAGALSLAFGGPALAGPDACTIDGTGTIETCSGNQSAGIGITNVPVPTTVATLNVNNLTTAITPASGTPGIGLLSVGDVTITSNTGAFGITTSNAAGITASNLTGIGPFADGHLTVTSTGNVSTTGDHEAGILAVGIGTVTVTSTGNIATTGDQAFGIGASVGSISNGSVSVTSTGNITTAGATSAGISASGGTNDAVLVNSTGNISVTGAIVDGIQASRLGGGLAPVTVTSTGNITASGSLGAFGISATGVSDGTVTAISTGNIAVTGSLLAEGIAAANGGNGGVNVISTGNIVVAGNQPIGILAEAFGSGAVTVTSTGNITVAAGSAGSGIFALSHSGPIAITIKSGTVSGGAGVGFLGLTAAVILNGGTDNTLTNMGTLMALSGLAIETVSGNNTVSNTVNNSGTVIGNVILGSATNAFNNMVGGLFNAGATVDLGAGNLLTNSGTLSPGGAGTIHTTAVTGNLVQSATGRLLTDINISGGTSDRINVSGTAGLAGAVQLQVQNVTAGPWQQTVLSATGGTTNSGLSLLASPALQAQLVFPNATDVVVKSAGINFVVPGLGVNQTALGNAFNGAFLSGGAGGGPIFDALLNGPTSVAGYSSVLFQLSGEAATGTQQTTFDAMNMFMGTMLDPFNRGTTSTPGSSVSGYASEGDASAYASDSRKRTGAERDAYAMFTKAPLAKTWDPRWSVWAAGFGGSQTTDGNAAVGSNSVTSRLYGGAVGADYLLSPNTVAGFALAGGGTSFSLANNAGSGRSDLFQAGVYARHNFGQAYISGALAYGWQDITTNRTVTLAGLDQLQARFNANAFSGRVEGGYRFVSPWMGVGITPYAAGQFTTFDLPAYAEQAIVGTNNFALAYGAKSVTDPRSELGFRTDKSFAMPDGALMLRGRLAWAHDYDPNRSIGATFQSLPGASFVVNGAAQASDSALVTASAEKKWLSGWSAAATFEGEFSQVTASYAGKGVVRYAW